MLSVCIKYSMRDLICDVIIYCVSSFAREKFSVAYTLCLKKRPSLKFYRPK